MELNIRNGEKQLLISHPKLDMDTVLAFASLWWFTDTYPSSIYPYRQVGLFRSDAFFAFCKS